MMDQFETFFN